jgi:hypothetical protein
VGTSLGLVFDVPLLELLLFGFRSRLLLLLLLALRSAPPPLPPLVLLVVRSDIFYLDGNRSQSDAINTTLQRDSDTSRNPPGTPSFLQLTLR